MIAPSPVSDSAPPSSSGAAPLPKNRLHLAYLDGLRALAALYVVHSHVLYYSGLEVAHHPLENGLRYLTEGHFAVVLFIVLSGYCLMLPVARSQGQISDLKSYFLRRARRILPPYYAALLLSLALIAVKVVVDKTPWREVLSGGDVLSHLLLVHNLNDKWAYTINGPLWSVATEWQIYFFFPLFLLPLWRRFGNLAAIVGGLILGVALVGVFPKIALACPWFLALFALGMAAADFNFSPKHQSKRPFQGWPLVTSALLALPLGFLWKNLFPQWTWHNASGYEALRSVPLDLFLGVACCALLVGLGYWRIENRASWLFRLFEWPPLVKIGIFSYSLYLIHMPLVARLKWVAKKLQFDFLSSYVFLNITSLALCIGLAYLFYLAFERPFLSSARREVKS